MYTIYVHPCDAIFHICVSWTELSSNAPFNFMSKEMKFYEVYYL